MQRKRRKGLSSSSHMVLPGGKRCSQSMDEYDGWLLLAVVIGLLTFAHVERSSRSKSQISLSEKQFSTLLSRDRVELAFRLSNEYDEEAS